MRAGSGPDGVRWRWNRHADQGAVRLEAEPALCLVAADQLRELHIDNGVAAWRADGRRIVAIERSFNRKLAALEPPDSIRSAVAAYTKANNEGFRDTAAAVAAAGSDDAKRLRAALSRADRDNLATGPPAKKIGATGC